MTRELPAKEVALLARELRLPVQVELGERLLVEKRETGYTHVVLERPGGRHETRMVAEPGDPIEVAAGSESLVARPGEAIVLESAPGEKIRIAVTSPR